MQSNQSTNDSKKNAILSLLFVYGTLRRNAARDDHRGLRGSEYVGPAVCQGKLYNLGWFPGIRLDEEGTVIGEVVRLPDENLTDALHTLDGYEGYRDYDPAGSLYLRKEVEVTMTETGEKARCWIYEYNTPSPHNGVVPNGDWLAVKED